MMQDESMSMLRKNSYNEQGGFGLSQFKTSDFPKQDSMVSNKDRKKSLEVSQLQKLKEMEELLPQKMTKKDLENVMEPDIMDDTMQLSEKLTVEWVHAFLDEIHRIDEFFSSKQNELIDTFIALQDKFRIRTELAARQDEEDEEVVDEKKQE